MSLGASPRIKAAICGSDSAEFFSESEKVGLGTGVASLDGVGAASLDEAESEGYFPPTTTVPGATLLSSDKGMSLAAPVGLGGLLVDVGRLASGSFCGSTLLPSISSYDIRPVYYSSCRRRCNSSAGTLSLGTSTLTGTSYALNAWRKSMSGIYTSVMCFARASTVI